MVRPSTLLRRAFTSLRVLFGARDERLDNSAVLIVGLGNPGERYRRTRHNAGFMAADVMARRLSERRRFLAHGAEITTGEHPAIKGRVIVAKPQTFMNRSGDAVGRLSRFAGVGPDRCLVIVDDVHLPVGKLRIRRSGSDGGHNGLKSIIGAIGGGFPRLRIGVGPAPKGEVLVEYVLGDFSGEEEPAVAEATERAADAALCVVRKGIDAAMNAYNK